MSFLTVAEHGADGLRRMLELGAAVKADPDAYRTALSGRSIGLFFMKPSLRTWVSSDIAAAQLGMHPLVMADAQVGLGTREAPKDVGGVLDRYVDALGMRVYDHADLEVVSGAMEAPVINLLSDREHPCQAVADLMTVAEAGPIEDSTVAFVGDGNNVCHSLMTGVALMGGRMRVATPPGYEPDPAVVEFAGRFGEVVVTNDPEEAVEGASAVYTDVWASMGQEDEASARKEMFSRYRVDGSLFGRAAADAVFLHCLPAHRGEEVTDDVIDDPRSRVLDQAENRLHGFKAVLLYLLG